MSCKQAQLIVIMRSVLVCSSAYDDPYMERRRPCNCSNMTRHKSRNSLTGGHDVCTVMWEFIWVILDETSINHSSSLDLFGAGN